MFDNLTREESLQGIDDRAKLMSDIIRDRTLTEDEIRQKVQDTSNEIKELWYHIYDLEGKPYIRE